MLKKCFELVFIGFLIVSATTKGF